LRDAVGEGAQPVAPRRRQGERRSGGKEAATRRRHYRADTLYLHRPSPGAVTAATARPQLSRSRVGLRQDRPRPGDRTIARDTRKFSVVETAGGGAARTDIRGDRARRASREWHDAVQSAGAGPARVRRRP